MKVARLPKLRAVLIFACLTAVLGAHPALAVDTDGDGLLDLIDAPGFDPNATGSANFNFRFIEDLDGATLLTGLQSLSLGSLQIRSIESGDFAGLSNLQKLNLSGNPIFSIANGGFGGLVNLAELRLDHIQISNLQRGIFDGLTNLELLDLRHSHIMTIERGILDGLTNLHYLQLSENLLESVEGGVFNGLTNLQSLNLRSNNIVGIESGDFDGLTDLQSLNLKSNDIVGIESGGFDGLTNLQSLDLRYNDITSLESFVFDGLTNLHSLLLSHNELSELNLAGATFQNLEACTVVSFANFSGFCEGGTVSSLILDHAVLSNGSFESIVGETTNIADVSLVGLAFSDVYPSDLSALLEILPLDDVRVDPALLSLYETELNAFAAIEGNTVTVVPEPSTELLLALAAGVTSMCLLRDIRKRSVDTDKKSWIPELSLGHCRKMMVLIVVCLLTNQLEAFNVIEIPQHGVARWDAVPHAVDGVERSLDGGLRYSLQGGSYEAFRDLVPWEAAPPSVAEFQAAVEAAFANWESVDTVTSLGTDLRFVADLETQVVAEPFSFDLSERFLLNRGAEIDLIVGAPIPGSYDAVTSLYFDPSADFVTLTSGVSDYAAAVTSGVDIYFHPDRKREDARDFQFLLTHEIGHALGLGDADSGKGAFDAFTDFYDDNFDGTTRDTARATLNNSFADLIDPLDPENSPGLMLYDVCDAINGDPFNCRSDPGVKTPGVHLLMESNSRLPPDTERPLLQNDDFAGRQFLYPQSVPEPRSQLLVIISALAIMCRLRMAPKFGVR